MTGNSWANFISVRVGSLIEESKSITDIFDHNGIRGSIRELFIKQFLEPFLPPQIGIGTGEIINHEGLRSRQLDVVLYNKHRVPPVLVSGSDTGIFPWECVIAVIEVKSTISASALYEAHINANSVTATYEDILESDFEAGGLRLKSNMPAYTPIPYYVFGFTSDLTTSAKDRVTEQIIGGKNYSMGPEGLRLINTFHDLARKRNSFKAIIDGNSHSSNQIKKAKTNLSNLGGNIELTGQKILGICVAGREWSTGNISFGYQNFARYGSEQIRISSNFNHCWRSVFTGTRKEEALAFLHQIIELSYEMPRCREHFEIARYLR
ncbi:DUF6602 domain-containing protein [Pseudomonas moraviensis]|uniref:DUF6602 domain-containing protein n=1 Tax=Pseudomonas moraviensis TaxID=321662 RepID=A0A7Y9W0V3_9PSED|nr:DUF6602 domain-containing protein [Pseudomonas moraviensis]NYH12205.1 hypothetical protein [Pseudomonas moraviensis]